VTHEFVLYLLLHESTRTQKLKYTARRLWMFWN